MDTKYELYLEEKNGKIEYRKKLQEMNETSSITFQFDDQLGHLQYHKKHNFLLYKSFFRFPKFLKN